MVRKQKYSKYVDGIEPHLESFLKKIDKSSSREIEVKIADLAKKCGMKMKKVIRGKVIDNSEGLHPASLMWGFKYALYLGGITIRTARTKTGMPAVIMSRKRDDDILPNSFRSDE